MLVILLLSTCSWC